MFVCLFLAHLPRGRPQGRGSIPPLLLPTGTKVGASGSPGTTEYSKPKADPYRQIPPRSMGAEGSTKTELAQWLPGIDRASTTGRDKRGQLRGHGARRDNTGYTPELGSRWRSMSTLSAAGILDGGVHPNAAAQLPPRGQPTERGEGVRPRTPRHPRQPRERRHTPPAPLSHTEAGKFPPASQGRVLRLPTGEQERPPGSSLTRDRPRGRGGRGKPAREDGPEGRPGRSRQKTETGPGQSKSNRSR